VRRLAALAPQPTLSAAEKTALLQRILDGRSTYANPPTSHPRRHRRVALASIAGIAAAITATVVLPTVLPAGTPGGPDQASATPLDRLADAAGRQHQSVAADQYAYVRTELEGSTTVVTMHHGTIQVSVHGRQLEEEWTAPDGQTWVMQSAGRSPRCLHHFDNTGDAAQGDYEDLPATSLEALPTDPQALAAYVDSHPSGDNRGTTNRMVVAVDLLRSGLAKPELRAATLRMLGSTPGISVDYNARDALGRPAVRVDAATDNGLTSLFFDPASSRLNEEQSGVRTRSVVETSAVVGSLPSLPTCTG
jgi:hypothetical protein